MKIVLLTSDQSNQRALASKLAKVCDVAAIVLSKNIPKKSTKAASERARILINRVEGRVAGAPFVKAWFHLRERYERETAPWPSDNIVRVNSVNDKGTVDAIAHYAPDYVLVSGTNMVGSAVIKESNRFGGILNLHTGISPYVKGGPNCTNWCLAEGLYHLIGNTVMWLDLGIDTGQLLATERTPCDGTESLDELHWKVMEHAHDLYVRATADLAAKKAVPRVPQDSITKGRTFYTREWTLRPMIKARLNFRKWSPALLASEQVRGEASRLRLFPAGT